MALELLRLVRNLANLKNEKTNENKFLKTKPKIQEYKQNIEASSKEAAAIHDYVSRAQVMQDPSGTIPPWESESFTPLIGALNTIVTSVSQAERLQAVQDLNQSLDIGIAITNAGERYLTTRGRALQIGATFTKITSQLASQLGAGGGTIK